MSSLSGLQSQLLNIKKLQLKSNFKTYCDSLLLFSSTFCAEQSQLRKVTLFDKTAIMKKLLAIYFIVFLFLTEVRAQIPLGVEKCADFCPAINSSDSGGLQDVRQVFAGTFNHYNFLSHFRALALSISTLQFRFRGREITPAPTQTSLFSQTPPH